MRVLIIKMSSLGDVVHVLPALTDAAKLRTDARFDWLVEQSFATIPAWHPAVQRIVPVALRQWRVAPLRHGSDWRRFQMHLRAESYDLVLDAQGLIKSAMMALLARGVRAGFDQPTTSRRRAALCHPVPIA